MSKPAEMNIGLEEFNSSGWQEIDIQECVGLSYRFHTAASNALANGDAAKSQVLRLLGKAFSMRLVPDSKNKPFSPMISVDNAPSNDENVFSQSDLQFFADIYDSVSNPKLAARLSDILWMLYKPRNIKHALHAIDNYTKESICIDNLLYTHNNWERGARLALSFGSKTSEKLAKIESDLLMDFNKKVNDNDSLSIVVGQLIYKLKLMEDQFFSIATQLVEQGKNNTGVDFLTTGRCFDLAHKFFKKINFHKDANSCLAAMAENHTEEAHQRLSESSSNAMIANSFFQDALQIYRRIPKEYREIYRADQKIKELRDAITKTGKLAIDQMTTFKVPLIDNSEEVEKARNFVSGKKIPLDALWQLIHLYNGPQVEKLKEDSESYISDSIIAMFGSTKLSTDGRVIARTPALDLHNHDNNKTKIEHEMITTFSFEVNYIVIFRILPAIDKILEEHVITQDYLLTLCRQSPLVPEDREYLTAKALWFGFENDFSTAIHLLTPQFEHMIRNALKNRGAQTTHIDKHGLQTENGLSTLLDLPEAEQLFGTNSIFEFKTIFTSSYGENLRNNVAHGLLNDNNSVTQATVYAWWLTLRWIILTSIDSQQRMNKECANDAGSELVNNI